MRLRHENSSSPLCPFFFEKFPVDIRLMLTILTPHLTQICSFIISDTWFTCLVFVGVFFYYITWMQKRWSWSVVISEWPEFSTKIWLMHCDSGHLCLTDAAFPNCGKSIFESLVIDATFCMDKPFFFQLFM